MQKAIRTLELPLSAIFFYKLLIIVLVSKSDSNILAITVKISLKNFDERIAESAILGYNSDCQKKLISLFYNVNRPIAVEENFRF